ncbi:hypothetical protein ACJ73_01483 [Blastomyces percursus]|uniref:Uncharacterized protein n=1 Tax=Blastomyces percursus TaxID=1658174 RepID=A0A1J9RHM4_9EURO|nr:hypothetical protein ACJ73_01483 [Blastomyces percursus]
MPRPSSHSIQRLRQPEESVDDDRSGVRKPGLESDRRAARVGMLKTSYDSDLVTPIASLLLYSTPYATQRHNYAWR